MFRGAVIYVLIYPGIVVLFETAADAAAQSPDEAD